MYLYIALFYDVDQMAAHTENDYEFGTPVIQVQMFLPKKRQKAIISVGNGSHHTLNFEHNRAGAPVLTNLGPQISWCTS